MKLRFFLLGLLFFAAVPLAHAAASPTFENGVYSVVDKHFLKAGEAAWVERELLQDPRDGHSYFGMSAYMLPQPATTPFVVVLKKTGPEFRTAPYLYIFLNEEDWGQTCLGDEMTWPQGTWHNSQSCDDYRESPL